MKKKKVLRSFPSKVLLFGEHIINKGANGLAIPVDLFSARLVFSGLTNETEKASNHSLLLLSNYLIEHPLLEKQMEINDLITDIEKGLILDSNIPQGYGLGSSGAFVAAILDSYGKPTIKKKDVLTIKNFLADMESCFHGKSSGLDPIVAYLNKPLIVSKTEIKEVQFKENPNPVFNISLLDTGISRKTTDWVMLFLERTKTKAFADIVEKSMLPANQLCIDSMLNLKYVPFWKSLKLLSQLQFDHMSDFIPKRFHEAWKNGLLYNEYYFKICGAGGGGFILCFSKKDTDLSSLRFSDIQTILKF